MHHDERFKLLLQEFFREFVELFVPDLLGELDLARAQWMQQELITDPPQGEKSVIDLLARVPLLSGAGERFVHVHIEVESAATVEPLRRRMYLYYHHLTYILGLEVVPVAVYLGVGLEGRGRDRYEVTTLGRTPLTFAYDYVGLPALPGEEFLGRTNVLGVALSALMRWPREDRVAAAVEALERLVQSGEPPRRMRLLCDVVNSYAPLEDAQRVELDSLLRDPKRSEVMMRGKTWTEQGEEIGQHKLLLAMLERKFGRVTEPTRERVMALPTERLPDLALTVPTAQSLRDLGLED